MPVSASSASLNRFPGLELKAWAKFSTGVLHSQFNIATTSGSASTPSFTFTNALTNDKYVVDVGIDGATFATLSAISVNGFTLTLRDVTSALKPLPNTGFVAVYG